ncbi:hypothetical protein PG997_010244 [Apiospora hydei]|uniref:Peptidase A1 domain-containing protein n=1 Tax=Apiospora hydei TaxID=1337664 RepID=A0ABR1VWG3_9PEZI
MKSVATLAAGSLIASIAHAQVVQFDIAKRATQPNRQRLSKREATTYEETITNEKQRGGYFATVSVGSPAQKLTLQLDTGSSDIWVPSSSSSVCTKSAPSGGSRGGDGAESGEDEGCTLGSCKLQPGLLVDADRVADENLHSVDSSKSTSFNVIGKNLFSISYVDGSHSKGDYFTDDFEIGGAKLTNMTMGLGIDTDIPYGLVGVGYALNEAIVADTQKVSSAYKNLPVQMMEEGLISTNAYSLWLNDLDASTGQILFGGVDTEKYEGEMSVINVQKDSQTGAFTSFIVSMTSLTANSPSGSDSLTTRQYPIPVVLDSGTTLSYLPTELAVQVWKEVGAVWDTYTQMAFVPCGMENSKGTFEFGFAGPNGPKISVDMTELVLDIAEGSDVPKFQSGQYKGQNICQFGIQNFTSEPFLLGDTFLRSAYVVYDLENNQIGMAKTDFNSTKSNIVAFPSKGATIPSGTVVQNQVAATGAAGGSVAQPTYAASKGFQSAAGIVPAFEWAQVAVIGATTVFMLAGSGLFLL